MPLQVPCCVDGAGRWCQTLLVSNKKYKRTVTWRVNLNTWFVKNLQYVLSIFELFLVLPLLYWLLRWGDFFAFFVSESPAIGCVQHLFMHLALQIRTSRRASRAALPVLRSQEMSSRLRRVMHVSGILSRRERKLTFWGWPQIDIPKWNRKLTILSVTNTYVHMYARMYIARNWIDPSFKASR